MMCEVYKLGDVSLTLASTIFLSSYKALIHMYSATANSSSAQYNPFNPFQAILFECAEF